MIRCRVVFTTRRFTNAVGLDLEAARVTFEVVLIQVSHLSERQIKGLGCGARRECFYCGASRPVGCLRGRRHEADDLGHLAHRPFLYTIRRAPPESRMKSRGVSAVEKNLRLHAVSTGAGDAGAVRGVKLIGRRWCWCGGERWWCWRRWWRRLRIRVSVTAARTRESET